VKKWRRLILLARHREQVRVVSESNHHFLRETCVDRGELTSLLHDPSSALHRLLTIWSEVPLLLMLDIDWNRGPLVLVGQSDRMMWPLLPPGSLLQLDQTERTVADGRWEEFERPVYLIEYKGRLHCCNAQRRGETLRLIPHVESPVRTSVSVAWKQAKVLGQLTPVFRPLATRGNLAGRPEHRKGNRRR
jgi:hypothetical protein